MNRLIRPMLLVAAVAAWFLFYMLVPRFGPVLFLVALYVPMVVGLSLLSGFTGQVSLGQAAFYGTGAYACAFVTTTLEWDAWLGILAGVAVSVVVAVIVGTPLLMLRGHYLVIGTLAVNVIMVVVFREWRSVTGGPNGLSGVPQLSVAGLTGDDLYFPLATFIALLAVWSSYNLVRSRSGRALQAIAASETTAESVAIGSISAKIRMFVWAAALTGISGALYAQYLRYVSPTPFGVGFSVLLLVMSVVGGISSVGGAVIGTALVLLVREQFRKFVPSLVGGAAPEYEVMVFGLLLAAIVIFVPSGLSPWVRSRFRRRLLSVDIENTKGPINEQTMTSLLSRSGSRGTGPIVEAVNVSKQFGGLAAIDEVTLEVRPSEVFAIIGPNGAGKTTLLNLISGVLKATSGRVIVTGNDVTRWRPNRVADLGVARTFQKPDLFPLLDVVDNVKVGVHRSLTSGMLRGALRFNAAEEQNAHETAMAALELVGVSHLANEAVSSLPFGALRLVELARALAMTPDVLLLDEPASGLTREERAGLGDIIRRIRTAGVAVVLVEHDVSFVMSLADRVLVLHHGKQIACGSPSEIRNDPEVVEAYLGTGAAAVRTDRSKARDSRLQSSEEAARPLLEVTRLHAHYGPVHALHGVDLRVEPGEVVAVVGRNGAGKSTLMRCLAGLLTPTEGSIHIDGLDTTRRSAEYISRLGASLVPERRELFWTMTASEHLQLGAYRHRRSADIAPDYDLVHRLFPILADRSAQRANSMSGGQQQMLAIARSLMAHPKVLLLDEPTLGLAPKIVDDILEMLQTLLGEREDLGVLIVEQNTAVLPIVDRVYVMEDGQIVLGGHPDLVGDDPAMQAAFLGEPVEMGPSQDSMRTPIKGDG